MKPSLADRILWAIERARGTPVGTDILVRMAEANGYKSARSAVWVQLGFLQKFGYIRPHKKGRGKKPSTWVPTVERPAAR